MESAHVEIPISNYLYPCNRKISAAGRLEEIKGGFIGQLIQQHWIHSIYVYCDKRMRSVSIM